MKDCPGIEALEALALTGDGDAAAHVVGCAACQGVLAIFAGRVGVPPPAADPACLRAEIWLAARERGGLPAADAARLRDHLAACEACRELAAGPDDGSP
jgi:hypothetical protein